MAAVLAPFLRLRHRLGNPSDWSLVVKFAIGPAIALAALLALSGIGMTALETARGATQYIVEVDMMEGGKLKEAEREFARADGELYRLLTDKAANPAHTDVAGRAKAIRARLDHVQRDLRALRATDIGKPHALRIDEAVREVAEYRQAAEVVTTMLDVDFATAVSMVEPFRKHADRVSALISQVSDDGLAQARARAQWVSDAVAVTLIAFGVLAILAIGGVAATTFAFGVRTVRAIRGIADATGRLAAADYDVDTRRLATGDELGTIVAALETFRTQALETLRLQEEREQLRRQAEQDERLRREEAAAIERRVEVERRAMLETLAREFRRSISSVIEAASRSTETLFHNAEQLRTSAERTRLSSAVMNDESGSVAEAMHIVAEAADELTLSFSEIQRQVTGSRDAVSTALHQSETAGKTVAMLARNAERIDAVAEMINQIAARTNLLALNASIEAARAGAAGQGFAVVAGEVKSLAGQTAHATDDVRGKITSIQCSAKDVVGATTTINDLIDQLNGVMVVVAGSVEQQVQAAGEITRTMTNALGKTRELVGASSEIRRAADANSDAANHVRMAVDELKDNFRRLQADAEQFMSYIQDDAA